MGSHLQGFLLGALRLGLSRLWVTWICMKQVETSTVFSPFALDCATPGGGTGTRGTGHLSRALGRRFGARWVLMSPPLRGAHPPRRFPRCVFCNPYFLAYTKQASRFVSVGPRRLPRAVSAVPRPYARADKNMCWGLSHV